MQKCALMAKRNVLFTKSHKQEQEQITFSLLFLKKDKIPIY